MNKLKVFKLNPNAILPTRNNPDDAGLDLYSCEDYQIEVGKSVMIITNISMELPENTVGMICDRSSMGKKGLKVHGGIIDVQYRGSINIVLWNHSGEIINIKKGDKVAQLLIIPILLPAIEEVFEELSLTNRNANGFGSSGR